MEITKTPELLQHYYHDYSIVPDEVMMGEGENAVAAGNAENAKSMFLHQQPIFPVRLHHMLDDVEIEGCDDIVGWRGHGRCVPDALEIQYEASFFNSR